MIIADTGFWVALGDDEDQQHHVALNKMAGLDEPLISTWPVMTEVCYMLLKYRGIEAELDFFVVTGKAHSWFSTCAKIIATGY